MTLLVLVTGLGEASSIPGVDRQSSDYEITTSPVQCFARQEWIQKPSGLMVEQIVLTGFAACNTGGSGSSPPTFIQLRLRENALVGGSDREVRRAKKFSAYIIKIRFDDPRTAIYTSALSLKFDSVLEPQIAPGASCTKELVGGAWSVKCTFRQRFLSVKSAT